MSIQVQDQLQCHTFVDAPPTEMQEDDIMKFGKYGGQTSKGILTIKQKWWSLITTPKNREKHYLVWCLKQDVVKQETKDMIKKY